jgi:hypothetical protein
MKPYHTKGILKQNKKKVEQKRNPRKQVTWMQELKHFQQPHHEKDYKFHSKKTKPQRNTFTSRGYASSDITT